MKSKQLISFCVTYFNQENFVEQSINSILAIDIPCDFEILCGDDGSTDNTAKKIKKLQQLHPYKIKYFSLERKETTKSINRASLNRLNLARHAKGHYILFLDGDDYYCNKSFIQQALNIFQQHKNVEICMFNFKYLYSNSVEEIFPQRMAQGFVNSLKYISQGMYSHSGACMFKNILDKQKINELLRINNFDDNAITIYMLQFGDLYYINEPIYTYRQTDNSLWNSINYTEQSLVNALDYKLISITAKIFHKQIAKRQYASIKYLYCNKKNLKDKLGANFCKYLNLAQNYNDIFIENILKWNELGIIDKIKTQLSWIFYKFLVKLL